MKALKEIGAGTCAGIAQVAVGHPFDTIKVRMQNQTHEMKFFNGSIDCLRKTLKHEGITGLYKGAWSPLIGAMFQNAAGFFSFAISKDLVRNAYNIKGRMNMKETFLAAGISACMALFVETPVDLLKVKMQAQLHGQKAEYRSVFHAGYKIAQERGIVGLYQGMYGNAWRFVPGRAVYFTAYQGAIEYLACSTVEVDRPSLYQCFIAGGFAGGIAWISTYPFDVIRNRLQADASDPSMRKYKGTFDCGKQIAVKEGFHGFFKGFTVCMVRAIPVNACIFTTYTAAMRAMEK